MTHLAAVLTATKTPLELQEVEIYKPGPHELLVKNEIIATNPVEFQIAKLDVFPTQYPAIIGLSNSRTVETLGPEVTRFKVGDIVAVKKTSELGIDMAHIKDT
jgi:NADPH:quinone reductase-like Zn-dependent oxidoreductase